jgi:hypothetical protein
MPLADNYQKYLRGEVKKVSLHRPPASEIANAALERWVLPRAGRKPEFISWRREGINDLIQINLSNISSIIK